MSTLDKAIQIAVEAHSGQKRKNGTPYILHPLRVMMRLTDPVAMTVGVLHDVVEDTDVTFEQLQQQGFSEKVLNALRLLTHTDGVPYEDYVKEITTNPIARAVKLADLEDNLNLQELPQLSEKDIARMVKYHKAHKSLLKSGRSSN